MKSKKQKCGCDTPKEWNEKITTFEPLKTIKAIKYMDTKDWHEGMEWDDPAWKELPLKSKDTGINGISFIMNMNK